MNNKFKNICSNDITYNTVANTITLQLQNVDSNDPQKKILHSYILPSIFRYTHPSNIQMFYICFILSTRAGLSLLREKSWKLKVREKSQGILEFVREIWNLLKSQGNLSKFITYKRLR